MTDVIVFWVEFAAAMLVAAGLERLAHLIVGPPSGEGGGPGGDRAAWRYRRRPRRPGPHSGPASLERTGRTRAHR